MGIEYPLPVLDPAAAGPNILRGVNYASAGAGILNDTGSIFISTILYSSIPRSSHFNTLWTFSGVFKKEGLNSYHYILPLAGSTKPPLECSLDLWIEILTKTCV
jgi:hypothetical protein